MAGRSAADADEGAGLFLPLEEILTLLTDPAESSPSSRTFLEILTVRLDDFGPLFRPAAARAVGREELFAREFFEFF